MKRHILKRNRTNYYKVWAIKQCQESPICGLFEPKIPEKLKKVTEKKEMIKQGEIRNEEKIIKILAVSMIMCCFCMTPA